MDIEGRKILVLGGYGLVGMAVCRELIACRAGEINQPVDDGTGRSRSHVLLNH